MKFWIGDLCYHDASTGINSEQHIDNWAIMLNSTDYFQNDGHYVIEGRRYGATSTMYGDGTYFDMQNREYPVDAGIIGFIEYLEGDTAPFGMHLVEFDDVPEIISDDGVIIITSGNTKIVIDTA